MAVSTRLKIGEVSKQTGVAVGALRYYERLGLLESERGENSYRYYPPEAVRQVQFVKRAQSLGFTLEDISEVLNAHQQGDMPCDLVQSILQEKIEKIEAQIKEMKSFKKGLVEYRDSWAASKPHPQPGDICPLIEKIPLDS
ncbi:MerR, DNA binding family [Synechococcus sp. PCC 7335]|uniref:heavy metal-responsive transcriptional regulator n=1 Tax=Synechococcus sp. (strain ATCC 29403 / PCC 7335) TaxID=91464 RepID=UPI00017EB8B9|nr:heavy metal-responsive transcriptional regulator [Synechococcus sp. PCC 7335]EDX83811.1 MerR, DNA binding family [Synechococcus sp. PCC 7335]